MSYDLALWVGEVPESSAMAADQFERRFAAADADAEAGVAPTSAVEEFVSRVTDILPEFDDSSPWAAVPLIVGAAGDFISLSLTTAGAKHANEIARIAAQHGFVCYDPQLETIVR